MGVPLREAEGKAGARGGGGGGSGGGAGGAWSCVDDSLIKLVPSSSVLSSSSQRSEKSKVLRQRPAAGLKIEPQDSSKSHVRGLSLVWSDSFIGPSELPKTQKTVLLSITVTRLSYLIYLMLEKRWLQTAHFFIVEKNNSLSDLITKLQSLLVLSSHWAVSNHLTDSAYTSECLWMLCLTCQPQRHITQASKSQSSNHLWVFSLHHNLQLSRAQCLSLQSKTTSRVWFQKSTCCPACVPETCDLSQREAFHVSFERLCLVLHPILMEKKIQGTLFCRASRISKWRASAAIPSLSSPSLSASPSVSDIEWESHRAKESEREVQWSVCASVLVYLSCTLSLNFLIDPASPVCIATCVYTNFSICLLRSVTSLLFCLPFSPVNA